MIKDCDSTVSEHLGYSRNPQFKKKIKGKGDSQEIFLFKMLRSNWDLLSYKTSMNSAELRKFENKIIFLIIKIFRNLFIITLSFLDQTHRVIY
jgi:hypothetical protein